MARAAPPQVKLTDWLVLNRRQRAKSEEQDISSDATLVESANTMELTPLRCQRFV